MSPLALSLRFLQTQSDARLAALARDGHERAFEALIRRYRRELLAYCRRVGSAGTNAEDTLQQALLQAWSAIRTGAEVRDPRAWLYRIVHNVAVSNQRRPVVVPIELRDAAGANGADHEAEQRMAVRDALAGLAALPGLQRDVMVGTAVDGMSHDELATALGLSSGAVRGLIYRARATLRAAAAAITPGPVIGWALRSGSGRSTGFFEVLGGGGSAGLGGILIKGGAIAATAGVVATATGISTTQKAAHHRPAPAAAASRQASAGKGHAASAGSTRVLVVDPTGTRTQVKSQSSAGAGDRVAGRPASGRGSGDHPASNHGFDGASGKRGGDGRDSHGGSRGGASGGGGRHSGHDGSNGGSGSGDGGTGSSSGSGSSASDSGSTTTTSGSGGDDHGGQVSGSGSDGSSGGNSGSGSSGSGSSGSGSSGSGSSGSGEPVSTDGSSTATASSDDGGSGSSGGGTTTVPTTTTSGDGGFDTSHQRGN